MLKLAARNLFRHRLRAAMTLAAIVFGVMALVLSGGFIEDIFEQLGEALIHSQSGHLQVLRVGDPLTGGHAGGELLIAAPDAIKRSLSNRPEIADAMARISFSGLASNGRTDWPIVGEGIEPGKEAALGSHLSIVGGRQLDETHPMGVLVGSGVARTLGLASGDHLTLLVNTLEGAMNSLDFEVIGVFQSFSKDFDARAIRIPLAAAQELLGSSGATSLVISLKQTADTEQLAESLKIEFEGKQPRLEVKTWQELNDFYSGTVALYSRQFGVLRLIILAMVLLSVANSVNMSVFERVGEFGTMMALGNRRSDVLRLITTESAILGLTGGVLGVAMGVVLALAISAIGIPMPPPPSSNLGYTALVRVVPEILASSFLVGFVAAVLAALLPAARVVQMPVVTALRSNV